MVEQHILLAEGLEDVFGFLQRFGNGRSKGGKTQVRVAGQPGNGEQPGQVDRPLYPLQFLFAELELL